MSQRLSNTAPTQTKPQFSTARLGLIAVLAFAALHAATIFYAGSAAKMGSYIFLISAPLIAAVACIKRARREGTAQGWTELTLALLIWSAGMGANMAMDLAVDSQSDVVGISILFYVLYGVPMIFAVASPVEERWNIRAVDGVLALALSVLFWIHTFTFAAGDGVSDDGVLAIRWLFDIENIFIAIFALARWHAAAEARPRRFFGVLTCFAISYGVVAAGINHLAVDTEYGTPPDLLIALPFLLLTWVVCNPGEGLAPMGQSASRSFSLAVRAGSPLLLPVTLIVVACTLIARAPVFAVAGFIIATLGYGLRSVLAQMRGIAERDRLDRLSRLDALTGLPNRRQFDATLHREWARARRSGHAFAVLVIDIDHFKSLNDNFGHQVGDERLRDVAQALESCLGRGNDFLARYGGEEFVAILTDTPEAAAFSLAERMREAVLARSMPNAVPSGVVTVSIGLAWTENVAEETPDGIVSQADAALYRAKEQGRNRVEQ